MSLSLLQTSPCPTSLSEILHSPHLFPSVHRPPGSVSPEDKAPGSFWSKEWRIMYGYEEYDDSPRPYAFIPTFNQSFTFVPMSFCYPQSSTNHRRHARIALDLSLSSFSSVQFSHSVVSNSLQPQDPHHARPTCPSPNPRAYPNSCPLNQ